MNNISAPRQSARLAPVYKIPNLPGYEWLTVSTLRHYIFAATPHRDSRGRVIIDGNGLAPAILRIGRRVLIDLDAFDAWVVSHRVEERANV
jgi:hypothetical protein